MLQRGSGVSCILKRRPTEYGDCHPGSSFCSALVPPSFICIHSGAQGEQLTQRGPRSGLSCSHASDFPGPTPHDPTAPTAEKSLNNSHDRSTSLRWDSNLISARGRARGRASGVAVTRMSENINFGLISAASLRRKTSVRRRQITGAGVCGGGMELAHINNNKLRRFIVLTT